MKKSLLFLLLVSSLSTFALAEDKATSGADYNKALMAWPQSVRGAQTSPTNQALYGFYLFKNNLPFLGFDRLTSISNLGAVAPNVKRLWQNELTLNNPFWRNANLKWKKSWSSIFSTHTEDAVNAWALRDLQKESDFKRAQALLRSLEGTDSGAWAKWQLALGYGLQGKTSLAVDYLQSLLDSDQKAVGQDEILMAAARMLYQDNKLDLAMKYYDKIQKSSDYWLESLEERAWIFARLNNFDRTLGEMKTVLNPAFAAQVGPESYFLTTLADLRVCDYTSIFGVLKDFKARNEGRVTEIQKLAESGHTPISDKALAQIETGVKSWSDLGADSGSLPRFINRDEYLNRAVDRLRRAHQELAAANALAAQDPFFGALPDAAQKVVQEVAPEAPKRLQVLAKGDVAEMKKNLVKLQLVETEAIHRMHVGQTYARQVLGGTKRAPVKDAINFPYDEKEVWMDELGHYEANTKGCPTKGGQTL